VCTWDALVPGRQYAAAKFRKIPGKVKSIDSSVELSCGT
jgi:hypothetical protein